MNLKLTTQMSNLFACANRKKTRERHLETIQFIISLRNAVYMNRENKIEWS